MTVPATQVPAPSAARRRVVRPRPRTVAIGICAGAVAVLGWCVVTLLRWPDVGAGETVAVAAVLLPSLVLGLVLALKRPDARVAPLLCLVGAVPLLVVGAGDLAVAVVATHPGALAGWVPALSEGSWMLLYVPAAFLLLTFPDGRLPGPRWRVVAVGLVAVPALFLLLASADAGGSPNGIEPPGGPLWLQIAAYPLLLGLLALLVAAAAAMVVRHHRATDPVVGAQLRWFALAAMLLPATLLLCWLSYLLIDAADLAVIGLALTAVALPAATTVALLRHDLYDVDRAVSAAVTYGAVSALLLGVFTLVAVGGGVLLGGESAVLAAVATGISAVALAPLRRRLQRSVDRRLYPLRQTVRTAVDGLRERLDDGRARPEDLEATLRVALRDPGLRLGYVLPGRPGLVDLACAPLHPGDGPRVPVHLGGTHVGTLLPVGSPASRELLRETAADVALMVEVVRSRLELTEALHEVADSRARLLQAGYRERRRLERDLHDGAQQRLVSLGMAVRLAQRHLDETDVDGLLDQTVAELGTAVAELRAIARGLRPLDLDAGLDSAIRALTTAVPLPVHLELDPAADVPDEVATTAYYVASEALANVVKHADAELVEVSVIRRDGHVHLRIRDDGRGGAAPRPGSGLSGLVDRVAAAGGTLAVGSGGPRGTLVEAVLPCGP